MAPPGAWWFAPDGWVGWVSVKPGDRMVSAGGGKGVCRNGQPQQAAGSVRQYYGKREERLAGRRCGKENRRPLSVLLPDERGDHSRKRCNVPAGNNSAAIVPGIQEHENRAQLVPEKGYLIENEPEKMKEL